MEDSLLDEKEIIEHEAIKNILKLAVINNKNFGNIENKQICNRIDAAAQQADWIMELLRMAGYTS